MLGLLLQYQSLKTVLLHTDANTRFRISTHMPSIRDVEKVVPLKVSSLDISRNCTTVVNGTEYKVGIFRHFPEGDVPSPVARENNSRGSIFDFDEFGFPIDAGNKVMLPGDVSFQLENRSEFRRDTEEIEGEYRDDLRRHEKALEMQAELKTKGITVEDYLKSLRPIVGDRFDRAFAEEARRRYVLINSPKSISDCIEHFKLKLLPFDCRRNNTPPPFTCYIQLTITKRGSRQIQRFEYNKKLFEASKCLHEALFGSRKVPIQVERVDLSCFETIYRLPVGFRLHAKHVHTSLTNLTHASFLSLVENSERLETVGIRFKMRTDALQSQIVRNARRIVIREGSVGVNEAIQDFPNLDITIEELYSPADIFSLIRVWLSGDRPIGASCRIEMEDDETAREVLRMVRTHYEMAKMTERCVTIDQTNSTKVEVSYVPLTPPCYSKKWMLKARIVNA